MRDPALTSAGLDRSFTIEETANCSCEQIIDNLLLGSGHTKFGCSTGAEGGSIAEAEG